MTTLTQQIAARTTADRAQARREWAALAAAAVTGAEPELSTVEDLGRALGLTRDAAPSAFEGDVEALQRHPAERATSESMLASVAARLAEFGDDAGLAAAIAAADARLRELRAVENQIHFLRRGGYEAATRARFLAEQHPRVFPEVQN
jgi:hypothetical protein